MDLEVKLTLPDYYENKTPNLLNQINADLASGNKIAYLFIGNAGTGKTFLANLTLKAFKGKCYSYDADSIYSEYLRLVTSNYSDKNEAISNLENCLCCNCLLDDLGCENNTNASKDFFESMLFKMHSYWKKGSIKFCIITTNLSLVEIKARYGDRVYGRLMEMFNVWEFPKVNYRTKDKKVNKA